MMGSNYGLVEITKEEATIANETSIIIIKLHCTIHEQALRNDDAIRFDDVMNLEFIGPHSTSKIQSCFVKK